MRSKKKIRKKRSTRLRGKPAPGNDYSIGSEFESEEPFINLDGEIEGDIIDTDEFESFDSNYGEPDDSEW